jgi:hypothetical protein
VQTFARIKRTQPMEVSPQINALVRCVAKTIIDMLPNQQSPRAIQFLDRGCQFGLK